MSVHDLHTVFMQGTDKAVPIRERAVDIAMVRSTLASVISTGIRGVATKATVTKTSNEVARPVRYPPYDYHPHVGCA
jgi:hypothetical protein